LLRFARNDGGKHGEHNMPARQNWFDGWRLFALLSVTLLGLSIWIAGMRGFEVDWRADGDPFHRANLAGVVLPRLLGRRAGPDVAEHIDPMAAPQPPLPRRQLCGLARHPRGRHRCLRRDGSRRATRGDLDRVLYLRRHRLRFYHRDDRDLVRPHAAAIGARAWRRLHLIGGYYLLFQFTVSFGKRIPDMPLYALFLIPLVAVFALRMIAMAPRAHKRRAG
jgi:hypothetical protein